MRIRRSVTRVFAISVMPAIAAAAIAYFGYYTVAGPRGMLALHDANVRLAVAQEQLDGLTADRLSLERRIKLLEPGSVDPDMVEEVARDQMIGSVPGQVAVPREKH
jgi:cell division protein FtsB